MPPVVVLDTGPLSSCVVPLARPDRTPGLARQFRRWLADCERAGVLLVVPAVCYYEALRELERRQAARQIERLREFAFGAPDRYLPLTTAHLEAAARLWGQTRRAGRPTAADPALDADVILAAQARSLGLAASEYVVATTNVGHLVHFVPAESWANVSP